MQTLQFLYRWVPRLLVVAAAAVILFTLFSDHKAEYGSVELPQGGVVDLPEGSVEVFLDDSVEEGGDPRRLAQPLLFAVVPTGGGGALSKDAVGLESSGEQQNERSQGIGTKDAVVKLDVPEAGAYRVGGTYGDQTATLSFGTSAFKAVAHEWKLLAGLIGGAILITLLPAPRHRPGDDRSEATGDGSSYDAPEGASYQAPDYAPYRG